MQESKFTIKKHDVMFDKARFDQSQAYEYCQKRGLKWPRRVIEDEQVIHVPQSAKKRDEANSRYEKIELTDGVILELVIREEAHKSRKLRSIESADSPSSNELL